MCVVPVHPDVRTGSREHVTTGSRLSLGRRRVGVTRLEPLEAALRFTPTTTAAALGAAALSTAFLVPTFATAGQQDAATGGGQVDVGTSGPGDTVAFTAKGTAETAKGQVQYVDREEDSKTVQHGAVSCIDAQGNTARIAGEWRDGGTFNLYVVDNGEGSAADNDIVSIVPGDPSCDFEPPSDDDEYALARGNAQVRDADSAE